MDRPTAIVTALTLARFPAVGLGWWAALEMDPLATVTFALTAVATDLVDGILARRWGVTTGFGSQLDSIADFTFYASLVVWTYMYVPEDIGRHLGLLATGFALYGLVLLGGLLLKGTIAVHDRVSRTAGAAGVLAAIYFIGFGYQEWMLMMVALIATADIGHRLHAVVRAIGKRRRVGTDTGTDTGTGTGARER